MEIRILTFIAILLLAISCKKEIPCVNTCGPEQLCIEGECKCPDGYYQINQWCQVSRENHYFGNLNCNCYDVFVIDLGLVEDGFLQLLNGLGSTTTDITLYPNETFKATFPESCDFDGTFSQFVDFTIVKINETQVKVDTRWWTIADGTIGECEGIFTH